MALVVASNVEGLIQRFRNSDANNNEWTIDEKAWRSFRGWTASQRQQVVDAAAKHNESIRTLKIGVFDDARIMNDETIDVFAAIVSCLRKVDRVQVAIGFLYEYNRTQPAKPKTIDKKLCEAIAKCPSDVRHLDCSDFSRLFASPRGLLDLAQRFPNLEVLEVKVPLRDSKDRPDIGFGSAFAEVTAQTLTSLRSVRIDAFDSDPIIPTLLSSLRASSSLRAIDLNIPNNDDELIKVVKVLCTSHASVERFTVRGIDGYHHGTQTDMTEFFDIDPISPSISHLEFFLCDFDGVDPEKAAKALQHVQYLRFGRCDFGYAMKLLPRLPHLSKFSCVSRGVMYEAYEPMTGDDSDEAQFILVSNEDIKDLCLAIEREGSLLNDIEVDLEQPVTDDDDSYPAIARLMGACKGRLVLNMSAMPCEVVAHVFEGAKRLRPDLKDLRLRFVHCELADPNYADLFRSLEYNETLTHLEVGFDNGDELETTDLTSEVISSLIGSNHTLRTLSLRDIPRKGATTMLEAIMTPLITTNRSLRALELHGSLPADCLPGARELAHDMLKENDVLSTLKGLDIPKGGPVESLLLQNRYGRIFLRANDTTPIGIWPTVLGRVSRDQHVGVMYAFLRAKPDVVRPRNLRSSGVAGRKRGRSAEE